MFWTLDYSKAFDTLPHSSIIKSCIQCRMPFQAVKWVIHYLKNRTQCVTFNEKFSSFHSPQSGVPQGSLLWPILFCCVLSSLSPIHVNTKMIKYADDINVLHFIRSADEDRLQSEFDHISSWSAEVGLKLNFSKCFVTNFITSKSLHCSPIYDSSGSPLAVSHSVKILGVTFSDDFKWNQHIKNIVHKASRGIFVIRNLKRSGCDSKILYNVYLALIRSVLLYCFPCFCNAPAYLLRMISKVESRVLRIVFGSSSLESEGDILVHAENMCKNS